MFNAMSRPLYLREMHPVPIGWATGPILRFAKSLALTGILSPDRPARSDSSVCAVLCVVWLTAQWLSEHSVFCFCYQKYKTLLSACLIYNKTFYRLKNLWNSSEADAIKWFLHLRNQVEVTRA